MCCSLRTTVSNANVWSAGLNDGGGANNTVNVYNGAMWNLKNNVVYVGNYTSSNAWNIVGGYAGQLSLGHATFYGIGGYTSVLLLNHYKMSPWISMWIGAVLAAVIGVAISYPCFRLRGPFFALGSIAFLEVFQLLVVHESELTGGASGLIVPLNVGWKWMIFQQKYQYLLIAFGLLSVTLLVSLAIKKSRFGYHLVAVREREDAARAVLLGRIRTVGVRVDDADLRGGVVAE